MKNESECGHLGNKDDWKEFNSGNMQSFNESFHEFSKHNINSNVLALLSESPNVEVSFQGLKRKLGFHQEILSRTLKRLEKDGVVIRTSSGSYRLSNCESFQKHPSNGMFQEGGVPVTQLWVPPGLNQDDIISKLKNTWFGIWRWYSLKEGKSGKVLTWISEDGNIWVSLRFMDNVMFIEAGPVGIVGTEKCIYSGYELLNRLMQLFNNKISEPKRILQPN